MQMEQVLFVKAVVVITTLVLSASMLTTRDTKPVSDRADQQAFVDACEPWDKWDKPAPPFRIYGASYYVGTCGIAAILVTRDDGHILIDTGTRKGAEVVANNVRQLGFKLNDIKLILYSHEHHDHMGGHAYLQRLTGAQVAVRPEAVSQIVHGKTASDDPQFSIHPDTEPVPGEKTSLLVKADSMGTRQTLDVAGLAITMHHTPGHTPGAVSWQWEECEGQDCKTIVYADSLSPVSADSFRFSDHPDYVAAYFEGLDRLAKLNCDLLLAPHPSHANLLIHLENDTLLKQDDPCPAYAKKKRGDLTERLEKEAAQ